MVHWEQMYIILLTLVDNHDKNLMVDWYYLSSLDDAHFHNFYFRLLSSVLLSGFIVSGVKSSR